MTRDRVAKLEAIIEANRQEYKERFDRICENQRRTDQNLQQLLGLFHGIKKAVWGAGALAGTIGGVFFAYFPQFIDFIYQVLHAAP